MIVGADGFKQERSNVLQKMRGVLNRVLGPLHQIESGVNHIQSFTGAIHGQVVGIQDELRTLRASVDAIRGATPTKPQPPLSATGQGPVFDYAYTPKVREWAETRAIRRLRQILAAPTDEYVELLDRMARFLPFFEAIPVHQPKDGPSPYWLNGWFPALDAISLYSLLALRNPQNYVEVGSGNSTKFARQAIKDHGLRTKIVSIDPAPRAEIDLICDRVIRQACEDVDSAFFEQLTSDDILFVDNSHRSFQNSDVTVFFMEILPALPKGMVVGIHDIFLPEDYPTGWEARFYNEQYLLAAYLFGGMDGGTVLLPNWYITREPALKARLDAVWRSTALAGLEDRGGAFWLVR